MCGNLASMQDCKWVIMVFDKKSEKLVAKLPLVNINLATVQSICNEPPEDLLYNSFLLKLEHIYRIRAYTVAEFNTQKSDYFIECDGI